MARLPVGQYSDPRQFLQHPSLGYSGSPNMAPTMAPPSWQDTMQGPAPEGRMLGGYPSPQQQPSYTNPFRSLQPQTMQHVGMPQAPAMPSPWLAALMGGVSGAADAANGTNTLGGLTSIWQNARKTYADAQAAAQDQNAQIDLANMKAANDLGLKATEFDAGVVNKNLDSQIHRADEDYTYREGGARDQYDVRNDQRTLSREEHIAALQNRYGLDRIQAEALASRDTHQINATYDASHPAAPKPAPPVDVLKKFAEENPVLQQQLDAYEMRQKAKHGGLKGKDLASYNALLQVRKMLTDGYTQPGAAPAAEALPPGVTEDDIKANQKAYPWMTREQIVHELSK